MDKHKKNYTSGKYAECFDCNLREILQKRFGKYGGRKKLARLLGLSEVTINYWYVSYCIPDSRCQALIARVLGMKSRADIWVYKGE